MEEQSPLFVGFTEEEVASLLGCLGTVERQYRKGETILSEGEPAAYLGVVRRGMALIGCDDVWGNHTVLGSAPPGAVFAEAYACLPGEPLLITVTAAEDTAVLLLPVARVLMPCVNEASPSPGGFSTPAPSPSVGGCARTSRNVPSARGAAPSPCPTPASSWPTTWAWIEAH